MDEMYLNTTDKAIISYCENLLLKFDENLNMSNLELFELANIIFDEVKWSSDFNGVIYFIDYCQDYFSIKIDFHNIERIEKLYGEKDISLLILICKKKLLPKYQICWQIDGKIKNTKFKT